MFYLKEEIPMLFCFDSGEKADETKAFDGDYADGGRVTGNACQNQTRYQFLQIKDETVILYMSKSARMCK